MRLPILSLLSVLFCLAAQAQLPEFSNLSSRSMNRSILFNALRVEDGILYSIRDAEDQPWLYKVNFDGRIVDSISLSYQKFKLFGNLSASDNKYYLTGEAQPPFESYFQTFRDRRAVVAVFSTQLQLDTVYFYNNIPENAGWLLSIQTGTLGTFIQPVGNSVVSNDTAYLVKNYLYFDTLGLNGLGYDRVLERYVLGEDALPSRSVKFTTNTVYSTVYANDLIYLYGPSLSNDPNTNEQYGSVGRYSYKGTYLGNEKLLDDSQQEFDPVNEAIGNRFEDRIYSCYVEDGLLAPACATAVLDIRDLKFQLLNRVKIQECGWAPSGSRCVAINDKDIFILLKDNEGNLGIVKYNKALEVQWSRFLSFPEPHSGLGISATPDGGLVLDCFLRRAQEDVIKLYKISANGEIITNVALTGGSNAAFQVYPNPFTETLQLETTQDATGPLEVRMVDVFGRLAYRQTLTGTTWQVPGQLPQGMYHLQLLQSQTGKLLHQQWLTRQAP